MFERSRRGESWQDVFQQKSRPGVVVFCSPRPVSEGLWADQALPLSGPLPLVPRAVSPPRAIRDSNSVVPDFGRFVRYMVSGKFRWRASGKSKWHVSGKSKLCRSENFKPSLSVRPQHSPHLSGRLYHAFVRKTPLCSGALQFASGYAAVRL